MFSLLCTPLCSRSVFTVFSVCSLFSLCVLCSPLWSPLCSLGMFSIVFSWCYSLRSLGVFLSAFSTRDGNQQGPADRIFITMTLVPIRFSKYCDSFKNPFLPCSGGTTRAEAMALMVRTDTQGTKNTAKHHNNHPIKVLQD